jgi:hypothetical protein
VQVSASIVGSILLTKGFSLSSLVAGPRRSPATRKIAAGDQHAQDGQPTPRFFYAEPQGFRGEGFPPWPTGRAQRLLVAYRSRVACQNSLIP